jgi:hypothetical protein
MAWGQGRYGWGTFGGEVPTFGVADTEVLGNVQTSLLEPNNATQAGGLTFQSGIWTATQAIASLTDRQRRFLSETGITVMVAYQTGTAGQTRYDLPSNVIDIRRIAWANEASPTQYVELPRADAWELDHGDTNWPNDSALSPDVYMEDHLPSLVLEVNPTPTDAGDVELTASTDGIAPTGLGQVLSIPDDFTPYLAWGVRADLLMAEGEGQDPVRAAHAESRYQEGIELARILVSGGA